MHDNRSGNGPADNAQPSRNEPPATADNDAGHRDPGHGKDARKRRALIIGAYVAAAAAFTAIGFGGTALIRGQAGSASAIPTPPAANQKFVEDDDGTGADSQENILAATVPGLTRISSARGSGSGVVLTQSGLVLTSSQIVPAQGAITVRVLPSGRAYQASVVGANAARGLALLQVKGGSGFKPVAVGNSRQFGRGAAATAVSTVASGKAYTLTTGNVSRSGAAVTIGGHRLTGLMQTTAEALPGQSAGGPVVNLSGQVVGIDLSGTASEASGTSYAVPINEALTVARQLKG